MNAKLFFHRRLIVGALCFLFLGIVFSFRTHSEEKTSDKETIGDASSSVSDDTLSPLRRGPWQGGRRDMPWGRGMGGAMGGGPGRRPFMDEWMTSRERIENIRKENPELADLIEKNQRVESEIRQTVEQYQQAASSEERQKLTRGLRDLLGKQFDLEGRRQRMEIELFEQRITRLKAALKSREENKDRLLDRRLQEIIQNPNAFRRSVPTLEDLEKRGFGPPEGFRGRRNENQLEQQADKDQTKEREK